MASYESYDFYFNRQEIILSVLEIIHLFALVDITVKVVSILLKNKLVT